MDDDSPHCNLKLEVPTNWWLMSVSHAPSPSPHPHPVPPVSSNIDSSRKVAIILLTLLTVACFCSIAVTALRGGLEFGKCDDDNKCGHYINPSRHKVYEVLADDPECYRMTRS